MTRSTHDFDAAMARLYQDAKSIGFNATYFLLMFHELGGVATARKLVSSEAPAEGFITPAGLHLCWTPPMN